MATLAEAVGPAVDPKSGDITHRMVEMCWTACNAFLDWERDYVLRRNASGEILQKHRQELKSLMRMIKVLQAVASDPDFPDRSAEGDFEILLQRLKRSWQLIHEPGMSGEEADRILRECFPNRPGT
jgi:hypothetical protein